MKKTYESEREKLLDNLNSPQRERHEWFWLVTLTSLFVLVCLALIWACLPK